MQRHCDFADLGKLIMDLDKKFSGGIYVRFDYGILETWGAECMS